MSVGIGYSLYTSSIFEVPRSERSIVRDGKKDFASRMEPEASDPIVVSGKNMKAFSRVRIPETYRLVARGRNGELGRRERLFVSRRLRKARELSLIFP